MTKKPVDQEMGEISKKPQVSKYITEIKELPPILDEVKEPKI